MAGNENSGRKKLEEELAIYKEKIKQITLEELATSKVYKHLEENDNDKVVKDIALPVYLKSKADKVAHEGEVRIISVDDTIIEKNETSSNTKNDSEGQTQV